MGGSHSWSQRSCDDTLVLTGTVVWVADHTVTPGKASQRKDDWAELAGVEGAGWGARVQGTLEAPKGQGGWSSGGPERTR